MSTKITWLENFYGWTKISEDFFSIEDWVNINGDIQLIRIDPKIAAKNMYLSSNINFLADFKLYQCDSPSIIRSNIPLRFFYNKKYGKVYELKGDNTAIYDLMLFITETETYDRVTRLDRAWYTKHNIFSYSKIFFDNVKAKVGRFEIVEDYETDLLNRIKTFEIYTQHAMKEPFTYEQKDYQRRIYEFMNNNILDFKVENDKILIDNLLIFFKDGLFKSTLVFQLEKKKFGQIILENSEQLDYHFFLKKVIKEEELHKYQNIENLAYIPKSYFENNHII